MQPDKAWFQSLPVAMTAAYLIEDLWQAKPASRVLLGAENAEGVRNVLARGRLDVGAKTGRKR